MAIRGNVGSGSIDVTTVDTVIYEQASIDRYQVTALNTYNDTGAGILVEFWVSPNLTSASGDKVASVTIGAASDIDINAIVGQGYSNLNIIAKAASVGLNASITVTEYTEGD